MIQTEKKIIKLTLEVEIQVTGNYTPAVTGGPADFWAPAEFEEHSRKIIDVRLPAWGSVDGDNFMQAIEETVQ